MEVHPPLESQAKNSSWLFLIFASCCFANYDMFKKIPTIYMSMNYFAGHAHECGMFRLLIP